MESFSPGLQNEEARRRGGGRCGGDVTGYWVSTIGVNGRKWIQIRCHDAAAAVVPGCGTELRLRAKESASDKAANVTDSYFPSNRSAVRGSGATTFGC